MVNGWTKTKSTIGSNQPAWRKGNKYIEVDYNSFAPKGGKYWQTFLVDNGEVINLTNQRFKTKPEAMRVAMSYMRKN